MASRRRLERGELRLRFPAFGRCLLGLGHRADGYRSPLPNRWAHRSHGPVARGPASVPVGNRHSFPLLIKLNPTSRWFSFTSAARQSLVAVEDERGRGKPARLQARLCKARWCCSLRYLSLSATPSRGAGPCLSSVVLRWFPGPSYWARTSLSLLVSVADKMQPQQPNPSPDSL